MEYNDDLLIYYIHLNNKNALQILTNKYNEVIKIIVNKMVSYSQLNNEEYNDLLEDCLFAFNKAIYSYRNENGTFYMYIKMIITNLVYSTLKSTYVRRNKVIYECDVNDNNPMFDLLKDSSDLVMSYTCNEEKKYLEDNVKIPFAKEVIFLKSMGYTYVEIAKMLNINKKKVDNILTEVKRKYHNLL